jgi:hypothetical protein
MVTLSIGSEHIVQFCPGTAALPDLFKLLEERKAKVRSGRPCAATNLRPVPQSKIYTRLECGEGEEQLAHSNYIF